MGTRACGAELLRLPGLEEIILPWDAGHANTAAVGIARQGGEGDEAPADFIFITNGYGCGIFFAKGILNHAELRE